MNKQEFITLMANETGLSKKDINKAIDAYHKIVEEALVKGDKVQFVGFGTYEVAERAARSGRNPHTGEEIKIAAGKSPKFKPGKSLKAAVK